MQIINDYTVNNVFETTFSTQAHKKSLDNLPSIFDAVQISTEARQAYNNSIMGLANTINNIDVDMTNRLNAWFNNWHTGANFTVNKSDNYEQLSNNQLKNNLDIKNNLEKEIDKIRSEYNYDQFSVAPQEMIDRMRPLQQKLNAINALGNSTMLDDDILDNAAQYLQELEDKWNIQVNQENSLANQFHSSIKLNEHTNMTQEEINERIRKFQEKSLYNLIK